MEKRMQNDPMIPGVHANLEWELERIVDCVRSLEDRGAARRPSAPDANSVAGIAAHALGAAREHVLGWALGGQTEPDADAFEDGVSLETLEDRYRRLTRDLELAFARLAADDLSRMVPTPGRGPQPVRDVLWWAVLHAAEHAGEAELTRDLVLVDVSTSPDADPIQASREA
jgi:hypothetical protein